MVMQGFASWILLALVLAMALPVAIFCIEVLAAFFLQPHILSRRFEPARPRIGVLVPAHNESAALTPTIENVKSQLRERDRLLVVADNCSDDTSAIAAALGVEVIERRDPLRIGKGYALDFGLNHFLRDPPEVLVIVDADCIFEHDSINALARVCQAKGRPVQALNLMKAPDGFRGFELAEFAWRVKNWVRPLGLSALGLPCQLTGTGMVFHWEVVRFAQLASGEIVEDLKLGLDLARAGKPPVFCPTATVLSYFPTSQEGIDSQKQRWQKGHLNMIAKLGPRTVLEGITNLNFGLMMLALDLAVPPLFLLALIEGSLLGASMIAFWQGEMGWSFYVVTTTSVSFALAIVLSWIKFGRDVLSARKLLSTPLLIGKKIWFYRRIVFGRGVAQHWVRTDRSKSNPP
jgi:cellulose synthase/poly-beta-1,6-N-acetylglucosamine synthase-like glycosyltransferase